jgi:titin
MRHHLLAAFLLTGCIADELDETDLDPDTSEISAELGCAPAPPYDTYAWAKASWNARITWSDGSNNEDAFRIERSDNGGAWFVAYEVGPNVQATTDGFYDSNKSMRYRVRSVKGGCESTPSSVATIPRSPKNLAGQYLGGGQYKLSWADMSNNETYFRVQVRVGSGQWWDYTDAPKNATTETVELWPGTNRFRIRAASNTGESWYTNEVSYSF